MSKMKPLTYGSLFSGTECMSAAAIGLPLVPKFFAEVEPYPCAILRSKFPDVPNLGDVTGIKYNQAERTLSNGRQTVDLADGLDILCGGSPCFVAGTLVLTSLGYRPIESLKVGDEVVGGITGEIRRVEAVGSKMAKVGNLKILGRPAITCTPNHPFYCIDVKRDERRKSATYAQKIPHGDYEFVCAQGAVGKYAGRVKRPGILTNHATPKVGTLTRAEVVNLAGWYVGDGYIRRWPGQEKKAVVFALVSKEKIEKFRSLYDGKFNFCVGADGKVSVCNTALADWLIANFGEHATGKHVAYWVYSDAAKQDFLDGYLATDGCTIGAMRKSLTVSPRLAYGIADLVGNASVSVHRVPPKGTIMGREVNQHDHYTVQCPKNGIRTKLINGRYASIIRNYDYDGRTTARVFNIAVSDEHAYVVEGICVHNCQDFSVAGKRAGADGDDLSDGGTTRSSLIFTYIRLLREIRPRYFIYENVPGMLTSNEGRDFAHFLVALGECGYEDVAWRVLDAQYVRVDGMERAVPQRRRRVWVVGRLGADYGGAAEILLEPHRDPGHLPPRRKTREEVAAGAGRWLELHGGMVGEAGRWWNGGGVANTLTTRCHGQFMPDKENFAAILANPSAFNFELWANPPHNLIDALCARRAGDWMVADKPQGYRAGSFGQFVADGAAGTLDCGHMAGVGNGTPCLVTDKPAPVASFDPFEPGGIKGQCVRTTGEANTLVNGTCPGHHNAIVQRVTNSNGGDVMPTIMASEAKLIESLKEQAGGYVIATFENHAQDSRVKDAANLAPTVGASNANSVGVSGNNPLVVFAKVSHPRGKDGEGERWAQSNVAGTRNVFDGERAQEVVVEKPKSTCLTPGDPIAKRVYTADGAAPTLQAIAEGSGISAQAFVLPQSADDLPRVIVRRLTPTECERLMGLPDGWTRVTFTPAQIADDALVEDFRRIHDAFAQMVAKPGTTPKPKTAKFVRDWLTRISDPATCPDAPRYKACGNGWAANQPRWILFNLLSLDNPGWQEEWFAPRPQGATAYGINAQASLMHPCTREVSQTLTVCHQGGGSTENQNNIKMI